MLIFLRLKLHHSEAVGEVVVAFFAVVVLGSFEDDLILFSAP